MPHLSIAKGAPSFFFGAFFLLGVRSFWSSLMRVMLLIYADVETVKDKASWCVPEVGCWKLLAEIVKPKLQDYDPNRGWQFGSWGRFGRGEEGKVQEHSTPSEQSRIQQLHSIQLTKVQQQTSRIQQPKGQIQQPKRQNSQLHDTLSTTRMRCYVAECGTGFLVDEPKLTSLSWRISVLNDQLLTNFSTFVDKSGVCSAAVESVFTWRIRAWRFPGKIMESSYMRIAIALLIHLITIVGWLIWHSSPHPGFVLALGKGHCHSLPHPQL